MPKRLMVAPQNKFEAARILQSEQQNDTANNAVNALKTMVVYLKCLTTLISLILIAGLLKQT